MHKRLFFMLARAFLSSVNPLNPHHGLKVLMMSTWATVSFATGLAAQHLDAFHDTQVSQRILRIASSIFLVALVVGYALWFLRGTQKKRDFVYGTGVCGFLFWLFNRPSLALSLAGGERDAFLWLDIVNLFVLLAVVA